MEVQLVLGFEGLSYGDPDYYAIQTLASIMGGGMSSRLFQEIRELRGLCYAIYSFHWSFQDTGVFAIHAATGEEDIAELFPVLLDEIASASASSASNVSAKPRVTRCGDVSTICSSGYPSQPSSKTASAACTAASVEV